MTKYKNIYKSVKGYYSNSQVCVPDGTHEYRENFSLYGSLRGGSRNLSIEKSDQCYCNQTIRGEKLNNGFGMCYPEKLCGDCNLNKSGLCSQFAEPSNIPGV
jgi:hypothetical protein